jgi:protein ImuB
MPLADALSLVPGLATAAAEPAEDAAALRRLAQWCGRYSPWTAPDATDGVKIEITGCAHLWGGEEALAADLIARLARQGITGHIAIAGTLGAAWACARFAQTDRSAVILPSAETGTALAPLPVEGLRLDPATAQGLRRVGLRRIGDLCAMPRSALARRFGETVIWRLDQAQGDLPEPLSPLDETPSRRVRLSFAEPITDPADLALAAERLVEDLVTRLAREGTGARRLALAFYRVDGRVERIALGTARPSRDPRHLAALFKERLDTVDPGLGVEDVILAAFAVDPLTSQQIGFSGHGLSQPQGGSSLLVIPATAGIQERASPRSAALDPSPGGRSPVQTRCRLSLAVAGIRGALKPKAGTKNEIGAGGISALLDRLGNRLGFAAVSRIEACESHIPERASVRVPVAGSLPTPGTPAPAGGRPGAPPRTRRKEGPAQQDEGKPLRPIRLFDPPEPVAATWLLPDAPPFRFTWRRRAHRVRRADGPERIAEEWWRQGMSEADPREGGDAIRDYYRVEDEEGRRFWLFRAGPSGSGRPPRWYVHGVFA